MDFMTFKVENKSNDVEGIMIQSVSTGHKAILKFIWLSENGGETHKKQTYFVISCCLQYYRLGFLDIHGKCTKTKDDEKKKRTH